MTTKRKSRILAEMHETVRDLSRLGFIDKRKMGELTCCAIFVATVLRTPEALSRQFASQVDVSRCRRG